MILIGTFINGFQPDIFKNVDWKTIENLIRGGDAAGNSFCP